MTKVLNYEQQMRAEEIERTINEYNEVYRKLKPILNDNQLTILDRLLELERRLTQLERENGIY